MVPGVLSQIGKKNFDETELDNETNEERSNVNKPRSPMVHCEEDVITQSKIANEKRGGRGSVSDSSSMRQRTNSSINFSDGDLIISRARPPTARKRPSIAVQPQASNNFMNLKNGTIENRIKDATDVKKINISNETNNIPVNPTARPSTAEAVNIKPSTVKITTTKHITKNKPISSPVPKSSESSSMSTTFKDSIGETIKEKVQSSLSTDTPSASRLHNVPMDNENILITSKENTTTVNSTSNDETNKIQNEETSNIQNERKTSKDNATKINDFSENESPKTDKEGTKEETDENLSTVIDEIVTPDNRTSDSVTSPCNSTKKEKKKKLKGKGGSSPKFCSSNQSLLSLLKNEKKLLSTETTNTTGGERLEEDSNVYIVRETEHDKDNPDGFETNNTSTVQNNENLSTSDNKSKEINMEGEPLQTNLFADISHKNLNHKEILQQNPQEVKEVPQENQTPNEFGDGSIPCSKCKENPPELPIVHYSAALGHSNCIYEMYQIKKASLFSFDPSTRSPLFYACANGQLECVELLLSLSPQLACLGDANGDSPLHAAACSGFESCCSALLNHPGININSINNVGMMPSHIGKNRKILELLFEKGADFGTQDIQGRTPLFVACAMNRPDCVSFLLEYLDMTEYVDLPNKKGDTPLHAAALYGHKDCCIKLLEYGAQPEVKNAKGLTAIDLARKTKHKRCLKTLMDYRLHHSVNFDTVLFLASLDGHKQLREMAKSNESINTALISNKHDIKLKHFKSWLAYKYTETKTFYYNTVSGESTEVMPEEVKQLASPEELARLTSGLENSQEGDISNTENSSPELEKVDHLELDQRHDQDDAHTGKKDTNLSESKEVKIKRHEVLEKAGKVTQEGAKTFFNMLNTLGEKITNGLKLDEYPSDEDESDDSSVSTTSSVDTDYSTDSNDSEAECRKFPEESQKSLYVAKSMRIIEKGDWIKYYGGGAKSFYYNTQTGDFTNTEPIEDTTYDKEGHEWQTYKDENSGLYFYYNTVTGVSQWHKPGTEEYEESRENEDEADVHEIQDVNELEL